MFTKAINRLFDLLIATILLGLTFPIFLFVVLAIKIFDKGSIFADNSERIGKDGKLFKMYKFRSMIPNAHSLIQNDTKYSELKKKWLIKKLNINEDPRITKIGKILRRLDIDELAQLINVFKGQMSIVGPRPFFPDELEHILSQNVNLKEFVKKIQEVSPGITGLWQVSGRNSNTIQERFKLDYTYAQKKSIFFDFPIILKTPFVILKHIIEGEQY